MTLELIYDPFLFRAECYAVENGTKSKIKSNNPNLRKKKTEINILSKSQLKLDKLFIKENKNNQTNQIAQLCKLQSFGKEKKGMYYACKKSILTQNLMK